MRTLRGTASAAVVLTALLLSGCTATSGDAPATATKTSSPASTPTTPPASSTAPVEWQDADALIILPSVNTPDTLPHGPSWVTEGEHLSCGIYDDSHAYDANGNDTGPAVFYGCRVDPTAVTFTYPDFDNPDKGMIGGCPSGFSAYADHVPSPLCNSGQVFASDTDHSNVLKTGQGVRFAGIECVATGADAMSCTETATSHGFRVSLSDYALF